MERNAVDAAETRVQIRVRNSTGSRADRRHLTLRPFAEHLLLCGDLEASRQYSLIVIAPSP